VPNRSSPGPFRPFIGYMDPADRGTARFLLERLIGEWRRYGRPFAVVHLQLPAEHVEAALTRLGGGLREADVLARWAAEELIVLLPETDQAGAEAAAGRLRAAVREIPMLAGALQWSGGSAEGLISRASWLAARPAAG
jgi:hypothetical protein